MFLGLYQVFPRDGESLIQGCATLELGPLETEMIDLDIDTEIVDLRCVQDSITIDEADITDVKVALSVLEIEDE